VCAQAAWPLPITVKVVLAGLNGDGALQWDLPEDTLHTLVCARARPHTPSDKLERVWTE
jgi:hypothetical protein